MLECGEAGIGWFSFWSEIQVAEEGWDCFSPFQVGLDAPEWLLLQHLWLPLPSKGRAPESSGLLWVKLASAEVKERVGSLCLRPGSQALLLESSG